MNIFMQNEKNLHKNILIYSIMNTKAIKQILKDLSMSTYFKITDNIL